MRYDSDLRFPFNNVYFKLHDILNLTNKKIYVLRTLVLFYCKVFSLMSISVHTKFVNVFQ